MPFIKNRLISLIMAFVLVLTLCSCSFFQSIGNIFNKEKSEEEEPYEEPPEIISDPNWPVTIGGVQISEAPQTVACLSPDLCEYIYDMDLYDRLCAVSSYCGFDTGDNCEQIGSHIDPDIDKISELAPQYVLTSSPLCEDDLIALQQKNISVIIVSSAVTLNGLKDIFRTLAIFFMGSDDGSVFGNAYVTQYEDLLDSITYGGEKTQIAVLRNLDSLMITGKGIAAELISLAFENAAGGYTGYEYPVSDLGEFDPYALFVGNDIHIIDLENSDLYKKKTAVKNDRIYTADPDILSLGTCRSINLIKDMMSTIYEDVDSGNKLDPAYPSKYQS